MEERVARGFIIRDDPLQTYIVGVEPPWATEAHGWSVVIMEEDGGQIWIPCKSEEHANEVARQLAEIMSSVISEFRAFRDNIEEEVENE